MVISHFEMRIIYELIVQSRAMEKEQDLPIRQSKLEGARQAILI